VIPEDIMLKLFLYLKRLEGDFDIMRRRDIRRWWKSYQQIATRQKPGRKVDEHFEKDVWAELIVTVLYPKADGSEEHRVVANVCYNYRVVRESAICVQGRDGWKDVSAVQALQFSDGWIHAFMHRNGFVRRRVTTEAKVRPTQANIREVMLKGQKLYLLEKHCPKSTYNMDETGINWSIGPVYLYVPADQSRASGVSTDMKLRITGIIAVNGEGVFAPLMLIIKHSNPKQKLPEDDSDSDVGEELADDEPRRKRRRKTKKNKKNKKNPFDERNKKVINLLHKREGFREVDGWKLKIFQKTVVVGKKANGEDVIGEYFIKYLINERTFHVITSQGRAWNDTIRMIMWIELVMVPLAARDGLDRLLLWMDGCRLHETVSVVESLFTNHIDTTIFPPNMTDLLQLLDLVVNAPIKAGSLKLRIGRMKEEFIKYRDETAEKVSSKNIDSIDTFAPPKAQLHEAITDFISLFDAGEFIQKDTMIKCAKQTGIIPNDDGSFSLFEFPPMRASGTAKTGTSMEINSTDFSDPDFLAVEMGPPGDLYSENLDPELLLQYLFRDPDEVEEDRLQDDMFNKEYKKICYDSDDDSCSDDNEGFVGMDDEPLRVASAISSVGFSADEHVQTDLVAASPTCSTPEYALKAPPTAETPMLSISSPNEVDITPFDLDYRYDSHDRHEDMTDVDLDAELDNMDGMESA
jgi:hypothetical protein